MFRQTPSSGSILLIALLLATLRGQHWTSTHGLLIGRSDTCNLNPRYLEPGARLPRLLEPEHYQLVIATDLEQDAFAGSVNISLKATGSARQILLHADPSLRIMAAHLSTAALDGTRKNQLRNVCRTSRNQLLVLEGREPLRPNQTYHIYLEFMGDLSRDLRAYYKGLQTNPDPALDRPLAMTQFESAEARRVFPCFDEPSFKATFQVTLHHSDSLEALSNTQAVASWTLEPAEEIFEGISRATQFALTPRMSSYLLAFVLGNFDHLEHSLDDGRLLVRVYAPLGRASEAQFALEMAWRSVRALEQYTGIQLPLRKLDLVGVQDFESGAMENWGLITFKESQLLIDERNSVGAEGALRLIAGTVLHEIAHQWFGDLVTMDWWNELWLNEGFATWIEFSLTKQVRPCAHDPLYYLTESHSRALQEDSRPGGRAVRASPKLLEVQSNMEELYDAISYNKGAAVIRFMANQLVGPHLFQEAVREYLREHAFQNARQQDLWASLEEVSRLPIGQLLDPWINEPGYPLITVDLLEVDLPGKRPPTHLKLTQARFYNPNNSRPLGGTEQRWFIPVSILLGSSPHQGLANNLIEHAFPAQETSLVELPAWFDPLRADSWLKLNANFSGFYRVQYSERLWSRLERPVRTGQLGPADRLNLVEDAQAFCRADRMPVARCIETLAWYQGEQEPLVLQFLVKTFREIHDSFRGDAQVQRQLARFARHLFANRLPRQVSLREWPHTEGHSMLHLLLVELRDPTAIRLALDWFKEAQASDRLLMPAVFLAVARNGSEDQFNSLLRIAERGLTVAESSRILEQLVRADDMKRLQRVLSILRNPKLKLETPLTGLLQSMVRSRPGRQLVLSMFAESADFEELRAASGGSPTELAVALASELGPRGLAQVSTLLARRLANWPQLRLILDTEMRKRRQYRQWSRKSVMGAVREYLGRVGGAGAQEEATALGDADFSEEEEGVEIGATAAAEAA